MGLVDWGAESDVEVSENLSLKLVFLCVVGNLVCNLVLLGEYGFYPFLIMSR